MKDEEESYPFPKKTLFAGGGTGGHVYMAIALADELRRESPSRQVLFAGTREGLESRIVPRSGYSLETIRIGGLKRVGPIQTLRTLLQFPTSLWSSFGVMRRFGPDVVVGVGGYSSGPLVLAAALKRLPTLIIEPNVYPGFTNRLLAPLVRAAAVAFAETRDWIGPRARLTGIPVREEFFAAPTRDFDSRDLHLLVFGGSRGSRPLNRLMVEAVRRLPDHIRILHQTGEADQARVRRRYHEADSKAEVVPYIDDMPERFHWADLIVSRAGASTLAEVTAAGRPALLVPFPHAADDHQRKNARALERRGAAVVLEERGARGEDLACILLDLEGNRDKLKEMARRSRESARPDATQKIIELLKEIRR